MIFGPTFKTLAGAQKRIAFERSVNPSEYRRGDSAYLYDYSIVSQGDGTYRLTRARKAVAAA